MKIQSFITFWGASIILFSNCGCSSIQPNTLMVTTPPDLEMSDDIVSQPQSENFSRGYYRFGDSTILVEGSSEGGFQKITTKTDSGKDPDIRNWASIAIANYRDGGVKSIKNKLKQGQRLNQFDLDSIRLCIDAYHAAMTTYSKVALQSMLADTNVISRVSVKEDHRSGIIKYTAASAIAGIYGIAVAVVDEFYATPKLDVARFPTGISNNRPNVDGATEDGMNLADSFLQKACLQFEQGNSTLCQKIRGFGSLFEGVEPLVLAEDVVRTMNGMTKSISWWGYRGDTKPYRKLSCSPDEFQAKWRGLQTSIGFYINDLEEVTKDIEEYMKKVKDPESRIAAEDLYNESIENTRLVMNAHRYIFTDVPFTALCKKAIAETRGNVSAIPWGNDELRMLEIARKFNRFIGQAAMLRQIRSPNSANIYRQYLTYLKDEVGKDRYNTIVQETRLVNLDCFRQSEEPFEENTINDEQNLNDKQ